MKMKNSLLCTLLLSLLTGCTVLKSNLLVEVGKDLTIQVVSDLMNLETKSFEKDSLDVSGVFSRDRFRYILGAKVSKKLTPKGSFYFENLLVKTQLEWVVLPDSVQVYVKLKRIKK